MVLAEKMQPVKGLIRENNLAHCCIRDVSVYDFREACLVNLRNKPKETPGGNRHKGLAVGRLVRVPFT